jgi:hypothetical protein
MSAPVRKRPKRRVAANDEKGRRLMSRTVQLGRDARGVPAIDCVIIDSAQIAIADLLPTQMTVGMQEVEIKRMRWRERGSDSRTQYLRNHRVPVVVGHDHRPYMIDRHHLILALYEEGIAEVPVSVVEDVVAPTFEAFWATLESNGWTHPFDDKVGDARSRACRRPFWILSTIPFGHWQALLREWEDTPRTRRPLANSGGRTSCVIVSTEDWLNVTSAAP